MKDLKVGTLCLVIGGKNIGRGVTVIKIDTSGDDEYPFLCRATEGKLDGGNQGLWDCLWFKFNQLLPIDGETEVNDKFAEAAQ
ncbi:hypothetical protein [Enterobacter hormaechei]|uniref:hypothetical protein n=1 Tax=Enterobacter hormaechei TaxID=158836 RepID=UPI000F6767D0|nr:hypothetical protein [Enterobacter hormaechei]HCI9654958.1 hypothetical protein [Enterobacter hormaechei subsp. xiangfangensis]MDV5572608.1 hypothetical protein [Enterobacter hormaechei]RSA03654.1 hypothetical protein EGK19_18265 [Enterobacter hormaechei]RSA15826.1 hypothetical protein EGK25_18220 [Enterobacter hormaechei]HDV8309907.1 hypothetical protein [Enterobacter hormaechei]